MTMATDGEPMAHGEGPPSERRRDAERRHAGGKAPAGMGERRRREDRRSRRGHGRHALALAADAGSPRARRVAAAHAFAQSPGRAQLQWDDLAQWPDWAGLGSHDLAALAWAVGAWAYAHELRRCIESRWLKLMRRRLGDDGLAALMAAPDAPDALRAALPPLDNSTAGADRASWEADLMLCGRECLLASVGSNALRRCLRELLWRRSVNEPRPWVLGAPNAADALTIVQAALARPAQAPQEAA